MTKKRKATFKQMLKIFDGIWQKQKLASPTILKEWGKELEKMAWTDEEFDEKLDEHIRS